MADGEGSGVTEERDLPTLNEGCISNIVSFIESSRKACQVCLVSCMFRSAAGANFIWEKFLPPNYENIILPSVLEQFPTKKELFLKMVNSHVLLNGEYRSLSIDKRTEKRSFMIGGNELSIAWRANPDYWNWVEDPQSRFPVVPELLRVCWLEIICHLNVSILEPNTKYVVYLVMKITNESYGLTHPPSVSSVKFLGQESCRIVFMETDEERRQRPGPRERHFEVLPGIFIPTFLPNGRRVTPTDYRFPVRREDGWKEVELGDFYNDEVGDGIVDISVSETKALNWKSGMVIEGVELRPQMNGL